MFDVAAVVAFPITYNIRAMIRGEVLPTDHIIYHGSAESYVLITHTAQPRQVFAHLLSCELLFLK